MLVAVLNIVNKITLAFYNNILISWDSEGFKIFLISSITCF